MDEVTAFTSSSESDKRDRLIDALLERKEFVDYWTYRWSDVLLVSGNRLRPDALTAYYQWLRKRIETNAPWDEIVRDILTAQGSSFENGATNFFALHQTPEEMAENASQAFLGLSIGCAKCHNHPLEKWTNDQYYAMANLFSRVRAKGWGGDGRNGDGLRTLFLATSGELTQPLTGKPQRPSPLDGVPLEFDDPSDRREHLASWLTAPENPYFSRSITNRVWANFMGRGLVENVDDMRVSNPATNEPLLAALADYLVVRKYDLKQLMRLILQSETYQRSSRPIDGNLEDDRFYARYYPRRLMAEVILDAVSQVTNVPTVFNRSRLGTSSTETRETKEYPLGTRALELHDSAVVSQFLSTFGRNKRDIVCDCERTNKPSMVQVLHIANGSTINEKLKADTSCVGKLFPAPIANKSGKQPADRVSQIEAEQTEVDSISATSAVISTELNLESIIETAYLKALSRYPNPSELEQFRSVFAQVETDELRTAVEDLYWGLMSSREFLFQQFR